MLTDLTAEQAQQLIRQHPVYCKKCRVKMYFAGMVPPINADCHAEAAYHCSVCGGCRKFEFSSGHAEEA